MKTELTGFCLFLFEFVHASNFKHCGKKIDITQFF
jgi:hypothetical protein